MKRSRSRSRSPSRSHTNFNLYYVNKLKYLKNQKCVLSPTKTHRPGPPYKASDCKHLGKLGNNEELYYSIPNKNGVYQWVKWDVIKKKQWISLSKGKYIFVKDN